MDYEAASDFEINRAVAEAMGILDYTADDRGVRVKVQQFKSMPIPFDPCNCADDAWPLILDGNIMITPRPKGHIGNPKAESWGPNPHMSICSDNSGLLRAAMIVFLKMQQN